MLTPRRRLDIIWEVVADEFRVPVELVRSRSHLRNHVRPRHVAVWLSRRMTRKSFPVLGRYCDRDHSTLIYAAQRIESMRPRLGDLLERLELESLRRMTTWPTAMTGPPDGDGVR